MAFVLLPPENKVLQESIQHKLQADKKEPCDAKLYDFDDVFYRVFIDPEKREKMLISLEMPNWADVRNQGSEALIKNKLGKYVKDVTNSGINFEIDMSDASSKNDAVSIGENFGKLRIFALGGPLFENAKALAEGNAKSNAFSFALRRDTHLWIVPKKDRLAVVFSFEFGIEADRIIANQILTEFVEVRRQRDVSNTPVVAYSKDPPGELQGQKIPPQNQAAFLGYFTVLLLPEHVKEAKLEKAVENVITFRSYLTYHIKCAKAYFHQSMRARVKSMLQILNRARFEADEDARKKKKIIVGAK